MYLPTATPAEKIVITAAVAPIISKAIIIAEPSFQPFGGGYPKSEAKRKIADANQLKVMRAKSQISFESFLNELDDELITKVRCLMERAKH